MTREWTVHIRNPVVGAIVLVGFVALIAWAVVPDVLAGIRQRRDLREAWQGTVIDKGMEHPIEYPSRSFLLIRTDEGEEQKRYVLDESYMRCEAGDYVIKPAGADHPALPEGEKPAAVIIEEARELLPDRP